MNFFSEPVVGANEINYAMLVLASSYRCFHCQLKKFWAVEYATIHNKNDNEKLSRHPYISLQYICLPSIHSTHWAIASSCLLIDRNKNVTFEN